MTLSRLGPHSLIVSCAGELAGAISPKRQHVEQAALDQVRTDGTMTVTCPGAGLAALTVCD